MALGGLAGPTTTGERVAASGRAVEKGVMGFMV
jgi:hypothetical protein